jgi:hypothetical protein
MDGCLCLWLFVQGELYPTELITLPFQGDNKLQDNNFGTLALTGIILAETFNFDSCF